MTPMTDATAIHSALAWRPLRTQDAAALARFLNDVYAADDYPTATSEEEAGHELAHPDIDLAHGTIAGFDGGGRMLARGVVAARRSVSSQVRVFLEGDVHPSVRGRGIGSALLGWLERRAVERLRELERGVDPAIPRLIATHYAAGREDRAKLFGGAGFEPMRWFTEMRRPLDEPVPDGQAPSGLRFEPWSDEHAEAARDAHNDAFRDHWGSQPITPDEWRHQHVDAPGFLAELSRLALDGDHVVAYVLCHRYPGDQERTGRSSVWLETLGTRRDYRRRGLASALIGDVLRAIQAAGFDQAELGVDTDNPTGAVGLYERLGFQPTRRWVFTAKQLEPG
jgi:ribosomal protein S18 acetylase RimI-like enzyme